MRVTLALDKQATHIAIPFLVARGWEPLTAWFAAGKPSVQKQDRDYRIGVPRKNILQLLPDDVVPSKEELAAYWRKVAKRALM